MQKLPLYVYDHDLTYDMLFVGNIDENIFNYLGRINNFPLGGTNLNSYFIGRLGVDFTASFNTLLALFDRRTPDGFLWADTYSTDLFYFYKLLSTSGQYFDQRFSANNLSNNNNFSYLPPINHAEMLGDRLIDAIINNVPNYPFTDLVVENKSDSILYLTWFSPAFVENNLAYKYPINVNEVNYVNVTEPPTGKIYNKKAHRLRKGDKVLIDSHCLLCSLVVSDGKNISNILDSQIAQYYFYKNFYSVFQPITDTILEGFKQLGNYCQEIKRVEYFYYFWQEGSDDPDDQYPDSDIDTWPELVNSPDLPADVEVNNPILPRTVNLTSYYLFNFVPLPDHYFFASLIYGDPDLPDLGKPLRLFLNGVSSISITFWNEVNNLYNLLPTRTPQTGTFEGRTITPLPESDYYDATVSYLFDITYQRVFIEPIIVKYPSNYELFFTTLIDSVISRIDPITLESENTFMPDSQRIKDIHSALEAGTYAYYYDDDQAYARVANIGYLVDRIATVLGISVEPDGRIRSIRQSKHIKAGDPIPAGWNIGQFGRNNGGSTTGQRGGSSTEDRNGIVYEVISNRFTTNPYTGEPSKIEPGGYVLVENILQYLAVMLDDFNKALGLQSLGAGAIGTPDKSAYMIYEGLHTLIAESLFMQSEMTKQLSQNLISNVSTQAMVQEVLQALGLPLKVKEELIEINGENLKIPYPGLTLDSPSLVNLLLIILMNLGPILTAISQPKTKTEPLDKRSFSDKNPELEISELNQIFDLSTNTEKEG